MSRECNTNIIGRYDFLLSGSSAVFAKTISVADMWSSTEADNRMKKERSYNEYYDRALQQASTMNGFGIKLVLGGTGVGKTQGVRAFIRHHPEIRIFYVANRVQLLNEMAAALPKGTFVHIKRDSDLVVEALQNREFYLLLETEHARRVEHSYGGRLPNRAQVRQAARKIEGIAHQNIPSAFLFELLSEPSRTIMRFSRGLIEVSDGHLRSHPVMQTLFPYMRFCSSDDIHVALVTLQKLFYGFFDGQRDVDISDLSGNVIFMDEFDFLEQDLLKLICESPQIEEVFKFVEPFYRTMTVHKLPNVAYPLSEPRLHRRLRNITDMIDGLRQDGLAFPDINHFFSEIDLSEIVRIFRTDRTLTTRSLRLIRGDRAFEIIEDRLPDSIGLNHVLGVMQNVTRRVLVLFKELKSRSPDVYKELLDQCYGTTTFHQRIEQVGQFPRTPSHAPTGFDRLLDDGYGVYEIRHVSRSTDPGEVMVNSYAMYTTPDRILRELAASNLVFGLSATADIQRCLRNFDFAWMDKQPDVCVLQETNQDRELIAHLNSKKQQERNNTISVHRLLELEYGEPLQDALLRLVGNIANDEGFGGDDADGYHRRRVERFFALLLWIQRQPKSDPASDTHMVFFTSYRQIEHLFREYQEMEGIYVIKPLDISGIFNAYEMQFLGYSYIVVFYNAQQGTTIESEEVAKASYHQLFWQGKPIILVTQYASAGNGVNLQYHPLPESGPNDERDFTNLYLLDVPFYFFSGSGEMSQADMKANIWQLAKLYHGKYISRRRFLSLLDNVNGERLSSIYIANTSTADDALLNRLAVLIQALGRIERVWQRMPDQRLVMSQEVFEVLELFVTRPQFESIYKRREHIISNNTRCVLDQIAQEAKARTRLRRRWRDEGLASRNSRTREQLGRLLEDIDRLRKSGSGVEIREAWEHLRRAVLRHDFHDRILRENACVYKTADVHRGRLYLHNGDILPAHLGDGWPWRLDAVYDVIQHNPCIYRYFVSRGYELGFNDTTGYIFTPYAYQAVLIGAIGESAIESLLLDSLGPNALEPISNSLYEVADLKISGQTTYIDCKNYSEITLTDFALERSDPAWHPQLNEGCA